MKNATQKIPFIAAAIAVLAGCASLEWRSELRPQAISGLDGVKRLGVFSFRPQLVPYGRLLLFKAGEFYNSVGVPGLTTKVALLYTSPEAITDFAVTPDTIAAMTTETGAGMIGDTAAFDYEVQDGLTKKRLMGAPLPDSAAVSAEDVVTYDSVTAIPEVFVRSDAAPETIKRLGRDYGVDAVLGLEPTVTGEIGQVTNVPSGEVWVKTVPVGNFVLLTRVSYDFVLYDAKTGAKMTDSKITPAAYRTAPGFEDAITDLGIADLNEVKAFLSGEGYVRTFEGPLKKAFIPYLGLFRRLYVATLQEKKQ